MTTGAKRNTRGEPEPWTRLSGSLPSPSDEGERQDILWQEVEALFTWYDRAAGRSRLAYLALKLVAIAGGAAVTVLAAVSAPAALTASVAATIVVMEGAQQLFQFHPNWINYRGIAEALRRQAFLYVAQVRPFDDPATRRDRLAMTLSDLTAGENAAWAKTMSREGRESR